MEVMKIGVSTNSLSETVELNSGIMLQGLDEIPTSELEKRNLPDT